jgi:aspartate carbamoyltransferase catalytic subunit
MQTSDHRPGAQIQGSAVFPHRHLTGISGLQPHEIMFLLDESEQWVEANRTRAKSDKRLEGLTQINAFFENSTRTLLSFEIAGKRLGADVVNMHAAQSSVKKGETLIDTAVTLNAMRADVIVIRHMQFGRGRSDRREGRLPRPQRRRRLARASHPGLARRAHHPPPPRQVAGQRVVICGDCSTAASRARTCSRSPRSPPRSASSPPPR